MPLIYRGGAGGAGTTSLALPTGTEVGDFIVIGAIGQTVVDARFAKVYDPDPEAGVWTGYATTLDPITLTAPGSPHRGVTCGAFGPPTLIGDQTTAEGVDLTVEVPSVRGSAAICVQLTAAHVSSASASTPPGYTAGVQNGAGSSAARFDYWNSTGPGDSPAGTAPTAVNVRNWYLWVLGVDPANMAPPCRLYPRSDELGQGAGRLWPPPTTQQAGRLNSSY